MHLNQLTGYIIEAAIKVHKQLGPGLFESVYEEALTYELENRGFIVQRQIAIPVYYDDKRLEVGFKADLIVNYEIIVEIKSIEAVSAIHKKQVITYLRLAGLQIGLLINFNHELLKDGITRLFNNFVE